MDPRSRVKMWLRGGMRRGEWLGDMSLRAQEHRVV